MMRLPVNKWQMMVLLAAVLLALSGLFISQWNKKAKASQYDWRQNWEVAEGFSLTMDSQGYQFPTSIAFVPNPGKNPKDPLYFVTELRGKIKVVTNDRSVYTFAENFFQLKPEKELPDIEGEVGLAGICLAPEQGYIFVTFAYQDQDKTLHNNIIRFETQPQVFSLKPTGQIAFTDLFAPYQAAVSHQIGNCQIDHGNLYVSVADGRQTEKSQEKDNLLGKILRLSLDGKPAADNPFYQNTDPQAAAGYVWAYGLRNPFGLKVVDGRVFTADNGSGIDRFIEIEKGENYLWDGSDWSIGARATDVIAPAIGPVQMDYASGTPAILPESYSHRFYIAASSPDRAGVISIPYDMNKKHLAGTPEYVARYHGTSRQVVVGVGLGPDGLYFVPLMPDQEGNSQVFRLSYDPAHQHPYLLVGDLDPESIMDQKGCLSCHSLNHQGGTQGPALDRDPLINRISARLNSPDYQRLVAELDARETGAQAEDKKARAEVAQATGMEKVRLWMIDHILKPDFDNPSAQMPALGLSRAEASAVTDYLLKDQGSLIDRGKAYLLQFVLSKPQWFRWLLIFMGGFVFGFLVFPASKWMVARLIFGGGGKL